MTTRLLLTGVLAALAFSVAAPSYAASITFNSETFNGGGGIGDVPTIVVIQGKNGAATTETGSVSWNGTADVETDVKSQSQTWSVTDLAGVGISAETQFGIVLNVNESGTADGESLDLLNLRVDFFNGAGTVLFSALCTNCGNPTTYNLLEAAQGTGSSGFLFRVMLTPSESTQFFGTSSNRIGLYTSIADIDNGQETFYLADLPPRIPTESPEQLVATPEPGSMILLGSGLASVAFARYRRRGSR
jgi:hypothetical protein